MVIRELNNNDIPFISAILSDIYDRVTTDKIEEVCVAEEEGRLIYLFKIEDEIFCYEDIGEVIKVIYLKMLDDKLIAYEDKDYRYEIINNSWVVIDNIKNESQALFIDNSYKDYKQIYYEACDSNEINYGFLYIRPDLEICVNPNYLSEPDAFSYFKNRLNKVKYVNFDYNSNPLLYEYNILREEGLFNYLVNKDLINYNNSFYYRYPFKYGKHYTYGDLIRKYNIPSLDDKVFDFYHKNNPTLNFYEQIILSLNEYSKTRPLGHSRIYFKK